MKITLHRLHSIQHKSSIVLLVCVLPILCVLTTGRITQAQPSLPTASSSPEASTTSIGSASAVNTPPKPARGASSKRSIPVPELPYVRFGAGVSLLSQPVAPTLALGFSYPMSSNWLYCGATLVGSSTQVIGRSYSHYQAVAVVAESGLTIEYGAYVQQMGLALGGAYISNHPACGATNNQACDDSSTQVLPSAGGAFRLGANIRPALLLAELQVLMPGVTWAGLSISVPLDERGYLLLEKYPTLCVNGLWRFAPLTGSEKTYKGSLHHEMALVGVQFF